MDLYDPADLLAVSLSCVDREFPYALEHGMSGPAHFTKPADLHPVFFGCFDWHSAVHNHWLLIRLRHRWPELAEADAARKVLDGHLTPSRLAGELAYFDDELQGAFSRPYGWTWVLRLHAEAATITGPDEQRWAAALTPLRDGLCSRLVRYFGHDLQFPIRTGLHGNTAFSLTLGIDSARLTGDLATERAFLDAAIRMFAGDRNYPLGSEPCGGDFLSPALTEAGLLATVLAPAQFAGWLSEFLPDLESDTLELLRPPVFEPAADDPGTVHLYGLLLSKAWSMRRMIEALPADDLRIAVLERSIDAHLVAAKDCLLDRHYFATHWMPTYLVMAEAATSDARASLAGAGATETATAAAPISAATT